MKGEETQMLMRLIVLKIVFILETCAGAIHQHESEENKELLHKSSQAIRSVS